MMVMLATIQSERQKSSLNGGDGSFLVKHKSDYDATVAWSKWKFFFCHFLRHRPISLALKDKAARHTQCYHLGPIQLLALYVACLVTCIVP